VLRELHVKNLAVLAAASVELGPGLNVLTGETGAGKSIVVDSLLLLSGARASSDLVRSGTDSLIVTGIFEPAGDAWRRMLEESGVETDGPELLIRREVSREGRNRVYVNDQPATARLLTDLAPLLLRIHGQREEMGLVDPELQRAWLDRSGGRAADDLLAAVAAAHEEWRKVADRLERLSTGDRERCERLDFLSFQAQEIDAANLRSGEDDDLHAERDVLRNREEIVRALGGAYDLLFDDEDAAVGRLGRSRGLLEDVAEWEPGANDWLTELDELSARVDDLARTLGRRVGDLEADPQRLDAVEERLARVERLTRKHGGSVAAVLEHRKALAEEIEDLSGDAQSRDVLERQEAETRAAYDERAAELTDARERWGRALAKSMMAEMKDLGLAKAVIEVGLEPLGEPAPHGLDRVVFRLAANPGEPARPLARVASGGELSRIYLALQLAARAFRDRERKKKDETAAPDPTLVFDEADAGISGAQAAALGKKLRRLAADAQILAVTHLPQVASCAHRHLKVSKAVAQGRTQTRVEELPEDLRVAEIARLLAGEQVTELSLDHARELIASGASS
jgi:DNA repair protein RecN (Recombination protein N)